MPRAPDRVEVARAQAAEPEALAGDDDLRAERLEVLAHERGRLQRGDLGRELDHERLLHPGRREQLEPPLDRAEQVDLVAEHDPRVRMEGDGRRHAARRQHRVEHGAVTAVDAVEGADRDRPRAAARAPPGAWATFTPAASRASTAARTPSGTRARASSGSRAQHIRDGEQPLGIGLLDPKRTDRGTPQARAVTAEGLGDRPDVGPGADVQLESHSRLLYTR